jgi:hypothetical protein
MRPGEEVRTNQLVCWEAHYSGQVSGKYVSEIACRCNKPDLVPDLERCGFSGKREVGMEVVHDLSQNPREIDGVDSTELECLIGIIVPKERLDNVLHARNHQPPVCNLPSLPLRGSSPGNHRTFRSRQYCARWRRGRWSSALPGSVGHTSQLVLSRIERAGRAYRANTVFGVEDEDRYIFLTPESINRRRPSLPAC